MRFLFIGLLACVGSFPLDASSQTTERVSVGSGGIQADGSSDTASISGDGRYVAFESDAPNLVSDDTNGVRDVFVHDRLTGLTTRVDVATDGRQANAPSGFGASRISASGRFVVFVSDATNLAADGQPGLFVRDLIAGTTERNFAAPAGGLTFRPLSPDISADGRWVAFTFTRTLTSFDNEIHVVDRTTGQDDVLSPPSGDNFFAPAISADGRYVAFEHHPTFHSSRCLRWDRLTEDVSLRVVEVAGSYSTRSSIAEFGTAVGFSSTITFDSNDENRDLDAYVKSFPTGDVELVSRASNGTPGNEASTLDSMSLDGRVVGFSTASTNLRALRPNDPPSSVGAKHVFLHDVVLGVTRRASVSTNDASGDADSYAAAVSGDGRHVAFVSRATNLVVGDTNGVTDVFVRTIAPVTIDRLLTTAGSELGGDVVHIEGRDLASLGESRVTFGGVPAMVTSASRDRVTLRTPPGVGTVDVSVSNRGGSDVLTSAYTYVAPYLAARYGNVRAATNGRQNVLLLNVSAGDPITREVRVSAGDPVQLFMVSPIGTIGARFVLYGWQGVGGPSDRRAIGGGLGSMVFPTPFTGGAPQPLAIWNNLGYGGVLGAPTMPSLPSPSTVLNRHSGLLNPLRATFQGLIEDRDSVSPLGLSVTNAIVLIVTP